MMATGRLCENKKLNLPSSPFCTIVVQFSFNAFNNLSAAVSTISTALDVVFKNFLFLFFRFRQSNAKRDCWLGLFNQCTMKTIARFFGTTHLTYIYIYMNLTQAHTNTSLCQFTLPLPKHNKHATIKTQFEEQSQNERKIFLCLRKFDIFEINSQPTP